MSSILITNATIVNDNKTFVGHVLIIGDKIDTISTTPIESNVDTIIDATGLLLFPGVIDDQVHFRTPGLTHKGDITTESQAAIAGGVTSFMDMPNVNPPSTTINLLNQRFDYAAQNSYANYSFYFGATNDNIDEVKKIDPKNVCGIKVFMGSSTGNMLVDNNKTLSEIFAESPTLVATHCEDEASIIKNTATAKSKYGENIPFHIHPIIRSDEACYISSSKAVELATKYNTQLHILHISSAKELSLFDNKPIEQKRITAEVCAHHLWFTEDDYKLKGGLIKWNPAIKSEHDRSQLREALKSNKLDIVATDHAPHTLAEKDNPYLRCPSGAPMVQHSLTLMLELVNQGIYSYEQVIEKMCHAPAKLFKIKKRGYIQTGFYADLVLVDPNRTFQVTKSNILYKCKWSPLENETFKHSIVTTILNGTIAYEHGVFNKTLGRELEFDR